MEVGVRELRNNLSRYLEQVKKGKEIVVTERGKPIARLSGLERKRTMEELIEAGLITPAKKPKGPARRPRVKPKGSVTELLLEMKRESPY